MSPKDWDELEKRLKNGSDGLAELKNGMLEIIKEMRNTSGIYYPTDTETIPIVGETETIHPVEKTEMIKKCTFWAKKNGFIRIKGTLRVVSGKASGKDYTYQAHADIAVIRIASDVTANLSYSAFQYADGTTTTELSYGEKIFSDKAGMYTSSAQDTTTNIDIVFSVQAGSKYDFWIGGTSTIQQSKFTTYDSVYCYFSNIGLYFE